MLSAIFGSRLVVPPPSSAAVPPQRQVAVLVIECSSRPQKKATAHHRKTRPRKTSPSDIRRGPAVYPPLPALPPDWSFVSDEASAAVSAAAPPEVSVQSG